MSKYLLGFLGGFVVCALSAWALFGEALSGPSFSELYAHRYIAPRQTSEVILQTFKKLDPSDVDGIDSETSPVDSPIGTLYMATPMLDFTNGIFAEACISGSYKDKYHLLHVQYKARFKDPNLLAILHEKFGTFKDPDHPALGLLQFGPGNLSVQLGTFNPAPHKVADNAAEVWDVLINATENEYQTFASMFNSLDLEQPVQTCRPYSSKDDLREWYDQSWIQVEGADQGPKALAVPEEPIAKGNTTESTDEAAP